LKYILFKVGYPLSKMSMSSNIEIKSDDLVHLLFLASHDNFSKYLSSNVSKKELLAIGSLYVHCSSPWAFEICDLLVDILSNLSLEKEDIHYLFSLVEVQRNSLGVVTVDSKLSEFSSQISDKFKWLVVWNYFITCIILQKRYDANVRCSLKMMVQALQLQVDSFFSIEDKLGSQIAEALELKLLLSEQQTSQKFKTVVLGTTAALTTVSMLLLPVTTPFFFPIITGALASAGIFSKSPSIDKQSSEKSLPSIDAITPQGFEVMKGIFGDVTSLKHYEIPKTSDAETMRMNIVQKNELESKTPLFTLYRPKQEYLDVLAFQKKLKSEPPEKDIYVFIPAVDLSEYEKVIQPDNDLLDLKLDGDTETMIDLGSISDGKDKEENNNTKNATQEQRQLVTKLKPFSFCSIVFVPGFLMRNKIELNNFWVASRNYIDHGEIFSLEWDLPMLFSVGSILQNLEDTKLENNANEVWNNAISKIISMKIPLNIFDVIRQLSWPYEALKPRFFFAPIIASLSRAERAGRKYAHYLMSNVIGKRPISLIGVSVGCKLIFSCLEELSKSDAIGMIENVVLLGAPIESERTTQWKAARRVVSGRFINCYCFKDWMLAYIFRCSLVSYELAGLQPTFSKLGIENRDVSDVIQQHSDYTDPSNIMKILQILNFK